MLEIHALVAAPASDKDVPNLLEPVVAGVVAAGAAKSVSAQAPSHTSMHC